MNTSRRSHEHMIVGIAGIALVVSLFLALADLLLVRVIGRII